ncbi:AP2/ERF family transcription factor [Pseudomonas sp. NPDC086278]|uniref:AP2/ERF family transcription factor n=1 Tax=Pseudomonas sp. NPDC086278 TaxID=3390646 RepID=UPI003CFDF8FB
MSIDHTSSENVALLRSDNPDAAASSNDYAIIKVRHKKSGALAWRVSLFREGVMKVHKEFTFISHGGERPARAAAERFRNEQMLRFPPQLSRTVRKKLRVTNTSGLAGVSRQTNGKNTYWVAQTKTRDGKKLSRSFNVEKFGEEQAKLKAAEARKEQLATIEHRTFRRKRGEKLYGELLLGGRQLRECEGPLRGPTGASALATGENLIRSAATRSPPDCAHCSSPDTAPCPPPRSTAGNRCLAVESR